MVSVAMVSVVTAGRCTVHGPRRSRAVSPLYLPYISPISPLYFPYISPISPLYLPTEEIELLSRLSEVSVGLVRSDSAMHTWWGDVGEM